MEIIVSDLLFWSLLMQMILFLVIILKITVNKTFFKFLGEVLWHASEKVLLKWCFLHIVDNQGCLLGQ